MTLRREFAARSPLVTDIVLSVGGAMVIILATQITVNLPFTPVPITGQTFGVLIASMLLGRTRAVAAVALFLTAGIMGAPVFANFMSITALVGPSAGYLLGFIPMAYLAGLLAEKGWTLSYLGAITTGIVTHTIVLCIGALVLAAFVGISNAWAMGVAPFLIGDIVKSIAAAVVVRLATSRRKD